MLDLLVIKYDGVSHSRTRSYLLYAKQESRPVNISCTKIVGTVDVDLLSRLNKMCQQIAFLMSYCDRQCGGGDSDEL